MHRPTLTCRCFSISNGRYGHPQQNRAITLREAACLQTFPDTFTFFGESQRLIGEQIGNAVPVQLAEAIGNHIVAMAAAAPKPTKHGLRRRRGNEQCQMCTARTWSYNMSRVKDRNNQSTELRFIELLRSASKHGWRRRYTAIGKPDFAFVDKRVAVFLDGCFWHSCPKNCKPAPRQNDFWAAKLAANRRRDREVTSLLKANGWTVIRIWEHSLLRNPASVIRRVRAAIGN